MNIELDLGEKFSKKFSLLQKVAENCCKSDMNEDKV